MVPSHYVLVRHVHGCEVIWWVSKSVERLHASHRNVPCMLAVCTHEGAKRHAAKSNRGHDGMAGEGAEESAYATEELADSEMQTAMFRLPERCCVYLCTIS